MEKKKSLNSLKLCLLDPCSPGLAWLSHLLQDFPGDPVAKIPQSQCKEPSLIPRQLDPTCRTKEEEEEKERYPISLIRMA